MFAEKSLDMDSSKSSPTDSPMRSASICRILRRWLKIKSPENQRFSGLFRVLRFVFVIRLGLANLMLCIDNQVVDIALPVVYTLRTRQCFNVLRHFSSDSANLIIFRDVHAILNVKVSAIGISILAFILLSNLNYLVSLEISVLV